MNKSILDMVQQTATGLHQAGIMDIQTKREFDALCLPPVKTYSAEQIKRIRLNNQVSQTVFATYLNISPSTVQKWEQGHKKPNGLALRLLELIERNGLNILIK
jgi:putative transcriptional regulator